MAETRPKKQNVNETFDTQYKRLNAGQKKAVDTIDGPVLVIAGPGTGKTSILTLRIANILRQTDTPPDAILALTFTESGVRAMRKKLASIIGPTAYRVRIYTFHGFANELIKTYPEKFPKIIGSEHMEDLEQIRIVEELVNESKVNDGNPLDLIRPKNDPTYYVTKIIDAIKELKRDNIDPKKFEKLVAKQEKAVRASDDLYHLKGKYKGEMKGAYKDELEKIKKNKELGAVYEAYEKRLAKERLYDYEDMIMEVVRTLEKDGDLLLRVQENAQYVLADEHQDANDAQNSLLELISSFHNVPNLFIVGDEKQAIFRFQGASLENFLYFKKKFSKVEVIVLQENYRSTSAILDAAHSLIAYSPVEDQSLRAELKSMSAHPSVPVNIAMLSDRQAEYRYMLAEIKKQMAAGTPAKEIAILIRDNRHAEGIERALSGAGVPVSLSADADALGEPIIASFLAFCELLIAPAQDEILGRVMFAGFLGLDPIIVSKAIEKSRKDRSRLIDSVKALAKEKDASELADLVKLLSSLSRVATNYSVVEGFEKVAHDSGFVGFLLKHENAHELIRFYDGLLDAVIRFGERQKGKTLQDFLEEFARAREYKKTIMASLVSPEGVALMTAHGSKGLEFDHVFIAHTNEGVWSGRRGHKSFSLPTGAERDAVEDERRLFYVALTRARKSVTITYDEKALDGKDLSPSRFIYEIDEKFKKEVDVPFSKVSSTAGIDKNKNEGKMKPAHSDLLKDKAYLNQLFIDRGFPVTHLNNFLECPWRYFFVDLLRVPAAQPNVALYGSAMHNALADYFNAYAREEDMSKEKAVELFGNYLHRTHMSAEDEKAYLAQGKHDLVAYLSKWKFPRGIWNEYKITGVPFIVSEGGEADATEPVEILLNGKLDKVEMQTSGVVNVVDYKTGSSKSRNELLGLTKNADGNYKRQLTFYKLLIDLYKKGEWRMETGTLDFLKPDDRGNLHREVFTIEPAEVEALKVLIRETAQKILDLSFMNEKCDDPDCEWCALRAQAGF